MNELSGVFKAARDGDRITLENRIYEVAPEDGFHLTGLFFSNTAKQDENPDGERFCAIYLDGKSDIVIDGNGAVIMLHGKMTPFIFCRCRNIVLKNIGFDHYRPTMSEFTVTKSAPGTAEIRINDEFGYITEGNMLYWCGDDVIRYEPVVLDKSSTAPVHKRLVVKNNRFISGTGRSYVINLNYLAEARIEGNTSDKELIITKNP